MSKKCAICGEKVGFFSGKFIAEKYVCNTCFELNKKMELSKPQEEYDIEKYPWTRIAEARAKAIAYKPWTWGSSNNKDK